MFFVGRLFLLIFSFPLFFCWASFFSFAFRFFSFFCFCWVSFCNFYLFFGLFTFLLCVWGLFFFQGGLSSFFFVLILNLSCKQTYDSWRLGHVVPDDDVITDTGDQALDIFLHGPESMHKNGIGKTITHTSIPIQPCTLLKQRKSKILNAPNMTPLFSCPLPVQCGGGRQPGSLADAHQHCSNVGRPRTVLTENICRCVQQIIEHSPAIMPFLTTSTITLSCLASAAPQADS